MKKRMLHLVFATFCVCLATPFVEASAEEIEEKPVLQETFSFVSDASLHTELTPEELAENYVKELFCSENELSTMGVRENLGEMSQKVYDILKEKVYAIAAGEESSPNVSIPLVDVGIERLYFKDLGATVDEQAGKFYITNAQIEGLLKKKYGFEAAFLLTVLEMDCPYELYWAYWGEHSCRVGLSCNINYDDDLEDYYCDDIMLNYQFTVGNAYTNKQGVDAGRIGIAKAAENRVKQLVQNVAQKSDAEKIQYYASKICELADYNDEAADYNHYSGDDTNPWQIVWVFDGDHSTKVVCEGYAKALKYLCDLTEWNSPLIECRCVTGHMYAPKGDGGHMWNIIRREDGLNYLMDLTNCDTPQGMREDLYLATPLAGDIHHGYSFKNYSHRVQYKYDEEMFRLYRDEELTLGDGNYKIEIEKITIENGLSNRIAAGKRVKLSAAVSPKDAEDKRIAWSSSNPGYASVASDGTVTCYKAGVGKTVTITAKALDGSGVSAKYNITIMKGAVKSIKLKKPSASKVKAGKTVKVKATVKVTSKSANKALSWQSSNPSYAKIVGAGKVKLMPAGKKKTVVITARATDGSGKVKSVKLKIK